MNRQTENSAAGVPKPANTGLYRYSFDLEGNQSASRVARLVGQNKTVLELGCGPGSQSKIFREALNCDVVGVELDPRRAQTARKYCRAVHVADLDTVDLGILLGTERFDVAVCADVLEHLRDPESLLIKLKLLLRPGGYLVASIPNITHASVVFQLVHGHFDYQSEGLLDSTHIRFFSRASAISLIETAGFWISEFQRVCILPEHTEFRTNPVSPEDRQVLALIHSRNLEANTYQFVIKAHPLADSAGGNEHLMSLRETLESTQRDLKTYQAELRRVNSVLDWYRQPLLRRLLTGIKLRRKRRLGENAD